MSAWVVDPETIDYLLAWALRPAIGYDDSLGFRPHPIPTDALDLTR